MAKPPAGSTLLFGALADSGRIKVRKNGSYRMVLKGVDEIDWFTDRPDRVEGTWKPQKLVRKWDKYFADSAPNAQAAIEIEDQRELFSFEMLKPAIKSAKMSVEIKPLSDTSKAKIEAFLGAKISNISLFIDDATVSEAAAKWQDELVIGLLQTLNSIGNGFELRLQARDLRKANLRNADLNFAHFEYANLSGADLTNAELRGASFYEATLAGANLSRCYLGEADFGYANLTGANLTGADLDLANLNGATWKNTTCPDGTINSGTSPCTAEQLNLA